MERISRISSKIIHPSIKLNKYCSLKNKTIVLSGGSRGIGLAIAKRCAQDGANIVILAKTTTPHPNLPGTIYTAAKEIEKCGGRALPLKCDIRNEENIRKCIEEVIKKFGGIDIVINNASAINLSNTNDVKMKRYDLMHSVNTRGTFLLTKLCLPHLKKSTNPHVITMSPPLSMKKKRFENHVAYSMAKYGMSMCVLGWAGEFAKYGISVNALWPRTTIATAAVNNHLGGDMVMKKSRNCDILSDSAYMILTTKSGDVTGQFFIDEPLLRANGITCFKKYLYDKNCKEEDLIEDFFVD